MRDCYIYLYSMLTWQENELWLLKWLKKFMYVTYIHIIQFWLDWRELSKNAFYKIKITLNSLQIWKIFNIWPHQLCKNLLEFLFGWLNTLQKKEVWDQLFCPAKRFKICHIYRKRKPYSFFHFSFWATFSFTLWMPQSMSP